MRILALDLGKRMGWAQAGDEIEAGFIDLFGKGKAEVKGGDRWPVARARFREAVAGHGVIYFEQCMGIFRNRDAAIVIYGLESALDEVTCAAKVRLVGVPQPSIKKHATGKGNAKKPEMIAAANRTWGERLGREVVDSNEADALGLLGLALEREAGRTTA